MFGLINKTKLIDDLCMMVDKIEAHKRRIKAEYDGNLISEWAFYKHLWNLRGKLQMLDEIVNKLGE